MNLLKGERTIAEKFEFGEISSISGSVRQNSKVRVRFITEPFIAKKAREKITKLLFDQRNVIRILI